MKDFLVYILLISTSLFSQNILMEVDTNKLRIGERFYLTVKSNEIDSSSVFWNQLDTMLHDFELLNTPNMEVSLEDDPYFYKKFLLTTFDTGFFSIPSPTFLTNNDSLNTNSITINFLPVKLDSTDKILDIKPVKQIPFLFKELVYYIFDILFVLLLLLIWIYSWLKYQNKTLFVMNLEPKIPIDTYYLNKLTELESKDYLKDKDFKSFYTRLSEIYRGYLEKRFNIPALESDTYDLKILLASKNLNESWFNAFFRNCDIVKFAKGTPELDQSKIFLSKIRTYIKKYGVCSDINEEISEERKALIDKEDDLRREEIKKKIYGVLIVVIPIVMLYLIYKFVK